MSTRLTLRRLVLVLGVVCSAACAAYPERTAQAYGEFCRGQLDSAFAHYEDEDTTGSEFLSGAEAGTVALAAGHWEEARRQLERAAAEVKEIEDRALVSAEGLADSMASWLLNDTLRDYPGEGFERVYLHTGLALAYLGLGLPQDVLVEAKRANQLLEREEELYDKSYRAGGLGHLISALAYELDGRLDDAYIDYERMVKKEVGIELAGKALVRLSKELGRDDEHERWRKRFGPDYERPPGAASVVVLAGVGLGPYKHEIAFPIPTPDGLISFAVPSYVFRPQPVNGLRLSLTPAGATSAQSLLTVAVEDVSRVAKENLDDRIAWMAAKSAARGVLKREITKAVVKSNDGDHTSMALAQIAGDIFSFVSERADLRCWQTLPDSWQAGRMYVAPGAVRIRLEALGGEAVDLGNYELRPGEIVFLVVRSVEHHLYVHALGGRPIEDPAGFSEPDSSAADLLQALQEHNSPGGKGSDETPRP